MSWRKITPVIQAFACLSILLLCTPALADDHGGRSRWVTAWGTSQQPNVAPATVTNATVRQFARVTIPGQLIRIRLDNTFGADAVTIGKASVAQRVQGALVAAGSTKFVTFGGSASVTIPVGGSVFSDPIALTVQANQDVAVNLYVPGVSVNPSRHGGAVVTNYISGPGDFTGDESRTPFTGTFTSTYWLKSVEVFSPSSTSAVVAFADSITDGTCSTLDAHDRWENWLAVRLDLAEGNGSGGRHAIVNEGIGGNTITRQNLSPPPDSTPGLERLDRDVFTHSGVSHVVLFEGTNDIRREASARQVINGMQEIIDRVHARGLTIYGVTIIPRHNVPPSGTNTGWNDAKTAIRNEVNQWIRTRAPFDAVIDFDKVVRQPANPNLLVPAFNCGDGIHPSPAGYYLMGKSVKLDLFERGDD
jgi:lysophospholipase L1-like esterase